VTARFSLLLAFLIAISSISSSIEPDYVCKIAANDEHHLLLSKILFNDISDGEFLSLINPSNQEISLGNWTISDGEGSIILPPGLELVAGGEVVIARNASRYLGQNGVSPDLSLLPNDLGIRRITTKGSFRLANDGDELLVADASGNAIDAAAFGSAANTVWLGDQWRGPPIPNPGRSRILVRQTEAGVYLDSDRSSDWLEIRDRRPGQSSFASLKTDAEVTCLLLPEHSDHILEKIENAKESITLCTYEFDSWQVFSALNRSMNRGVSVRLLLEGSPAGGISNRSIWIINSLVDNGAEVYLTQPAGKDSIRRYSYVHAKYAVIDDAVSIVLSENLVYNVFDTELGRGNRGWAAIADSRGISMRLLSIFESDTNEHNADIRRIISPLPGESSSGFKTAAPHRIVGTNPVTSVCGAELFAFPDSTGRTTAMQDLMKSTRSSISLQLFYVDAKWSTPLYGDIESPLVDGMVSMGRRADQFRLCLDNNSLFSDSGARNRDALARVVSDVLPRCPDAEAGFAPGGAPFDIVHNKGMVLDHKLSWVSSVNWNYESPCANREIALLIDDESIAQFYESCIIKDLQGESDPPVIQPLLELSDDRTAWELTIVDSSDASGIRWVTLVESGEKHNWSMNIPYGSHDVGVRIYATDVWNNSAACDLILFPTGSAVMNQVNISPGIALSGFSAVSILFVSIITIRNKLRGGRPLAKRMREK
jgi:phosphatidylserine/phosphatidylglycerophosphate/cardiolipin synthase-like enzyme